MVHQTNDLSTTYNVKKVSFSNKNFAQKYLNSPSAFAALFQAHYRRRNWRIIKPKMTDFKSFWEQLAKFEIILTCPKLLPFRLQIRLWKCVHLPRDWYLRPLRTPPILYQTYSSNEVCYIYQTKGQECVRVKSSVNIISSCVCSGFLPCVAGATMREVKFESQM